MGEVDEDVDLGDSILAGALERVTSFLDRNLKAENRRLREALGQSASDLSVASKEILNLDVSSYREKVAAERVAQFCHSQSEIARTALHTPEPADD